MCYYIKVILIKEFTMHELSVQYKNIKDFQNTETLNRAIRDIKFLCNEIIATWLPLFTVGNETISKSLSSKKWELKSSTGALIETNGLAKTAIAVFENLLKNAEKDDEIVIWR